MMQLLIQSLLELVKKQNNPQNLTSQNINHYLFWDTTILHPNCLTLFFLQCILDGDQLVPKKCVLLIGQGLHCEFANVAIFKPKGSISQRYIPSIYYSPHFLYLLMKQTSQSKHMFFQIYLPCYAFYPFVLYDLICGKKYM